jgi:hypothetical protein
MSANDGDNPPSPELDAGVQGANGSGAVESPARGARGLAKGSGDVAIEGAPCQRGGIWIGWSANVDDEIPSTVV